VEWRTSRQAIAPDDPHTVVAVGPSRTGGTVLVPTTETPSYVIEIDDITGGRRLLSDDIAALERLSFVVARKLDAVRLSRERFANRLREEEAQRRGVEARLEALRAQIHPHFLFNALNTIGYLVGAAPSRAVDTLLKLTQVLRQVLKADTRLTTLDDEMSLVSAYLEIEQARFEERLTVSIDVPDSLRDALVPPLVMQPLVENAVKHGITPLAAGGSVRVHARESSGAGGRQLVLTVTDTGVGPAAGASRAGEGVGLANLKRRLELVFGATALVTLTREDSETTARVVLPLRREAVRQAAMAGKGRP
jgi:LytS/YehU family sensor histidine kinase